MKNLKYTISIAASPKKVWDTMTGKETYKDWTNAAWPGSDFKGEWKQGENLKFTGNDGSGTLATVTIFDPYSKILLTHIALLQPGSIEDTESEWAKKWTGSLECYNFTEKGGTTELTIDMKVNEDWEAMFNEDWPKALARLKQICEA
ncbi:SRPBCC domain-containing protein [Flavobacterium sp. MK4S-17]|uniref:SRPBCC domain-containing protein n=1 Tax=Flavobacterium sp. MK4S-17 TaxID=2543737 RepID=UPI00135A5A0A|nr:SRPBCC domain-containing protein [Flavobacterium sp. MK4S-17]